MNPQNQQNSLRRLYETGSSVFDLGDYDTFQEKMKKPESRQKFYSSLSQYYDLGDYKSFEGKVLGLLPSESPQQQYDDTWSGTGKRMLQGVASAAAAIPRGLNVGMAAIDVPISKISEAVGIKGEKERGEKAYKYWAEKGKEVDKYLQGKLTERFGEIKPASPEQTGFEGLKPFEDPLGTANRLAKIFVENAPTTAMLGIGTMVNPVFGTAMLFGVEAGDAEQAFDELEAKGIKIDPSYRKAAATSVGALNAMLERVGFDQIFKSVKVPGLKSKLFQALIASTTEGATEALQEVNQIIAETGTQLSEDDLKTMRSTFEKIAGNIFENKKRVEEAGLGGAVVGGGISALSSGGIRKAKPAESPKPKEEAKPAEPQAPPEPEIPKDLQDQLEKVSQELYQKKFSELGEEQQFAIAEELTKARAAANEKKFKEAVKRAVTPEEQKAKPAKEAEQQFDAVSQEVYGKPFADITEEQQARITEEFDKAQKAEQDRKLKEVVRKTVAPKQPEVEKPKEETKAEPAVEKPVEQPAAEAEVEVKPEEPAKEEKPPTAEEFKKAQAIFDKAVAKANEQRIAEQGTPKVGDKVKVKGRNTQYEVIGISESGNIRLRGPKKETFAVKPSKIDVGVKGGQALIDLQKQFVRAELEKAGISKTIIDELAEPRRSPRPFTEEGDFRELTTRKGRIERAVEPPAQVKGKVDEISEAAVDFRNKEAELEKAKADIIEEVKARGGEVVVDTETGAFTVKLQPGKTKMGISDTLALQKLRREAAEAGAYSLATVGRGFEIAATPEKIADAAPLQGTFADKIKEFIRRNQAYKEAGKAFDKAKAAAHDDLVDAYLTERAAGREPQAFKGMSKAGVAVEVLTRRNRSAIEPDIEAEGRDFPKEVAQMKQEAAKRGVKGEPFLETRKAGAEKVARAEAAGTLIREQVAEYTAIPNKIKVEGKSRHTRNSKGQLIHPTKEGIENFWKWFGDSKVVDEQGRPLVMYHGTTSNFDTFDTSKNSKDALYGAGFYFTDDPTIAGGEYSTREIFTYHNTEEEALSQENRVGFSWREDYGNNAGKWVARIQKPTLSAVGYVHKGKEAIKKSERDKYIVSIIEHEEFKRAMSPGYLTKVEKNRVEEILSNFENTGNLDVLQEITSQPYNISIEKIFEDAGLSASGAVIPVFLKIDKPINVESGLTDEVSSKLIKGITKLWPKSNFDYIKSTFSGIVEDNKTFTEKESVEDAIYGVRNEIAISENKDKQFTNSNFPELFQASGFDGITHTGGLRMGRQKHRVYIAFEPAQIKSAIGNRGTFSPTEPSIIKEQAAEYTPGQANAETLAPIWYSQMERVLEQKLPNSGTPESFLQTIEGFQKKGEFKKEEIEWIGMKEWLSDQKGKVTKQQVLEFVKENQVGIREVPSPVNKSIGTQDFMRWQLPGGENYRELLLTLPSMGDRWKEYIRKLKAKYGDDFAKKLSIAEDDILKSLHQKAYSDGDTQFKSSHFDEPNILAHVRFNERTDADGKRVLFIEEVQSDWHQKGREKGYRGNIKYTMRENEHSYTAHDEAGRQIGEVGKGVVKDRKEAQRYMQSYLESKNKESVPNAPFKTTWHELVMKRMLRYAAENGFERVAWTTGEQQAERYDLSKQVSSIDYTRKDDGTILDIYTHDGEHINKNAKNYSELSDIVGKEIAQKIINNEGQKKKQKNIVQGTLSGLDLKVGGEGMKGFYDKILPQFMDKYGKKWGAKTVEVTLPKPLGDSEYQVSVFRDRPTGRFYIQRKIDAIDGFDPGKTEYLDRDGDWVSYIVNAESFSTQEAAIKRMDDVFDTPPTENIPVHSIDITPAMRDAVLTKGQALFEQQAPYLPNYKKRPDASFKTNQAASQAVNAIGNNRRRGRVLLANAINAEAREKGAVSLIGKEVRTSDDVAVLAQVYRDPRWETLRYIFVKNGKIVHVTGVSNRLPAATAVFPVANEEKGIAWLNDLMKSTKADGYYILHNHPSGKPNPSPEDINMTKSLLGKVNGFKGHVIIDSNNYTVLVQPGDIGKLAKTTSGELNIGYNDDNIVEIRRFRFFGEERLLAPSTHGPANGSLGLPIRNMIDIAEVGKRFKKEKGWAVLISSSKVGVRGIMEVDENLLQDKKRTPALLRKFARQTGAPSVFAYVSDEFFHRNHPRMAKAITEGFVVEVVSESGYSALDVLYIPNKRAEFGIREFVGREVKEGGAIPDKITVDGKERPARNSKGQLIHPTLEGIENFWKWFGDSKVVDEQGRPLVVYHARRAGNNFKEFRPGSSGLMWFALTERNAKRAALASVTEVLPVYLRADNPLNTPDTLVHFGTTGAKYDATADRVVSVLEQKGADLLYVEDEAGMSLAVIDPTQIKSATGNIGTFSPTEPSIIREDVSQYRNLIATAADKTQREQMAKDDEAVRKIEKCR